MYTIKIWHSTYLYMCYDALRYRFIIYLSCNQIIARPHLLQMLVVGRSSHRWRMSDTQSDKLASKAWFVLMFHVLFSVQCWCVNFHHSSCRRIGEFAWSSGSRTARAVLVYFIMDKKHYRLGLNLDAVLITLLSFWNAAMGMTSSMHARIVQ